MQRGLFPDPSIMLVARKHKFKNKYYQKWPMLVQIERYCSETVTTLLLVLGVELGRYLARLSN